MRWLRAGLDRFVSVAHLLAQLVIPYPAYQTHKRLDLWRGYSSQRAALLPFFDRQARMEEYATELQLIDISSSSFCQVPGLHKLTLLQPVNKMSEAAWGAHRNDEVVSPPLKPS